MSVFFPALNDFQSQASEHGLVAVCHEFVADFDTPLTLFTKIAADREQVFLFESMEGGEKWGRYSFIGYDPLLSFESKGKEVIITDYRNDEPNVDVFQANPLEKIKELVEQLSASNADYLPPFSGGAVGFMGYEMVRFMEELPDNRKDIDQPDSSLIIPRIVLAHDSLRQMVTVICWVPTAAAGNYTDLYEQTKLEIQKVVSQLKSPVDTSYLKQAESGSNLSHEFSSNLSQQEFCQIVEKAKEYILSGDIIQVVLSQRFHTKTDINPLVLYRALRHINPSPYLFFLKLGDIIQIGSSPEILVKKQDNYIDLRPIAGTRKRGQTIEEDQALEKELLADPKERAEHLMLVDLGRNDVGRVAKPGGVSMNDLLVIEKYSHVMHIVSGVRGEIDDSKDQFDVLAATFPAGTVSGAPKIRAMQIIDELEPEKRGAYAGSVGYFGFSGNMDFCITIRTFVLQGEDLYIQAGAGVVADSVPELEYEETINKSMALRRALELAQAGF
ncbi:MAG: anthranilate synthase component I [Desulfotalea sp.]